MPPIRNEAYSDSNRIGQIIYNGVVLNPTTKYKLSGRVIRDDASRVYKCTEYTLFGTFLIWGEVGSEFSENQCSANIRTIRERLSEVGRELRLIDIGFGDTVVNKGLKPAGADPITSLDNPAIPSGARLYKDVAFGPVPQVMDFGPFGNLTWEVAWTCTYTVVEQSYSATVGNPLLALNYTTDFEYDSRGYTTVTVNGSYELPVSAADYKVTGSGSNQTSKLEPKTDEFWDKIKFKIPEYFRPGARRHSVNAAKNRGEFFYQINELEGEPFPPGIVDADIDEDWENTEPQSFSGWNGTIGGTIELAKGQHPTVAARRFLNMFINRLIDMRKSIASGVQEGGKYTGYVLPVRFSFGCKRFTQKFRFSAQYAVLGCIPDFMNASGIFKPLGTKYDEWVTSMALPFDNRGVSKVKSTVDVIIAAGNNVASTGYPIDFTSTTPKTGQAERYLTFDCEGITPENSFLAYENHVQVVRIANVYEHRYAQSPGKSVDLTRFGNTLEAAPSTSGSSTGGRLFEAAKTGNTIAVGAVAIDALSAAVGAVIAQSTTNATSAGTKANSLEYKGTPKDYVVMTGKVLRIKHQPEIPSISLVGDTKPVLVTELIEAPRQIATVGHCPVYTAAWQKIYLMPTGYKSNTVNPTKPAAWSCEKPFG